MTYPAPTPATVTTLLLCGGFANEQDDEVSSPLTPREFNDVLGVLRRLSMQLPDLLTEHGLHRLRNDLKGRALLAGRLEELLRRRAVIESTLARWERNRIWVLDRTHPDYPLRYTSLLGDRAPPLIYGAGDVSLLNDAMRLAIVGSRDIDRESARFTQEAGRRATELGVTVISGGARGVDRTAVDGALDRGGRAVVVLPGDLARVHGAHRFRATVDDGRLALLSPYPPEQSFSGENALGRNRLIYCLGDIALVVSATYGAGGTWSGATEALRRGWIPVYVRDSSNAPDGNRGLIELGGRPFPQILIDDPEQFARWLVASVREARSSSESRADTRQLELFPEG